MKGLQPGETLIKDTGWSPVTWWKSIFRQENGKLTLTNRRLIFDTGKMEALRVRFELSLGDITSVDKGSRSTIKVTADQEYTFKSMRNAKKWVDLINSAVRDAQTAPSHVPPQPAYQPPPSAYTPPPPPAAPAAQRSLFCTECGSPLVDNPKFCGSCGKKL